MSIALYLTGLLLSIAASTLPRIMVNEANLLAKTSTFILQRHLKNKDISALFADNLMFDDPEIVKSSQLAYPVESIQASTKYGKYCAEIKYQPGLMLSRETLHFDSRNLKINSIQTIYSDGMYFDDSGKDDWNAKNDYENEDDYENDIDRKNSLESARILDLACRFLEADVDQDLETQFSLLSDDAVAFGVQGKNEIISIQKEGIEGGTTYSLPFPIQIDTNTNCVSLDFLSHKNRIIERGTDIMYFDLTLEKVVRIDTLRHTLIQPPWVKKHFNL